KKFEQVETGSVETIENMLEDDSIPQKGEFVILIEGIDESSQTEQWWKEMDLKEHVDSYINEQDMRSKDAIKQVALDRNMKKRDVYEAFHIDNENKSLRQLIMSQ